MFCEITRRYSVAVAGTNALLREVLGRCYACSVGLMSRAIAAPSRPCITSASRRPDECGCFVIANPWEVGDEISERARR